MHSSLEYYGVHMDTRASVKLKARLTVKIFLSTQYGKLYIPLHIYLEIRRWHNTTQPKLFSHRSDPVNVFQWVLELLFCWMKDRCFNHLSWTVQTGENCSVARFTCIACWFCFLRAPEISFYSMIYPVVCWGLRLQKWFFTILATPLLLW